MPDLQHRSPAPSRAPAPVPAITARADRDVNSSDLDSSGLDNSAMLEAAGLTSAQTGGVRAPDPKDAKDTKPRSHRPGKGTTARKVYDKNDARAGEMDLALTESQRSDMKIFLAKWEKNRARYEAVAAKTGVPAKLIAAIHWRESTCDFGTYLHQGDPLGKKPTHYPTDIPIFHKWEDAAVHALNMKKAHRDSLKMDEDTTDKAALATYAELYNGLGYHNRGVPSAYVWSGTDQYKSGKYVADGKYSASTKDTQLGVMAMMEKIDKTDAKKKADKKT